MTVQAIRLENFMAFQQTDWIELRPICLLFGLNSSGKSAIIRALRLLRQSRNIEGDDPPLRLNAEGQLSLGSYREALHHSDQSTSNEDATSVSDPRLTWIQSQCMTFQFRCLLSSEMSTEVQDRINQARKDAGVRPIMTNRESLIIDYGLQYCYDDNARGQPIIVGLSLDCPEELAMIPNHTVFAGASMFGIREQRSDESNDYRLIWYKDNWRWESDFQVGMTENGRGGSPFQHAIPQTTTSLLPDLHRRELAQESDTSSLLDEDYNLVQRLLHELNPTVYEFLDSIHYLEPVRPKPERLYLLNQYETKRWEQQGLGALAEFLQTATDSSEGSQVTQPRPVDDRQDFSNATLQAAEQNEQQRHKRENAQRINKWLKKLKLGISLKSEVHYDSGQGDIASSIFVGRTTEQMHNLADVGFGTSQVIPIILACMSARRGDLLIIEQPELHLHPRAQADLADLFIETQNRGVRLLLETHSADLLLRIRLRVSQTSAVQLITTQIPDFERSETERRLLNSIKTDNLSVSQDSAILYWIFRPHKRSIVQTIELDHLGDYQTLGVEFQEFFSSDMDDILELNQAVRQVRRLEKD